jgi:hypothetical protein
MKMLTVSRSFANLPLPPLLRAGDLVDPGQDARPPYALQLVNQYSKKGAANRGTWVGGMEGR